MDSDRCVFLASGADKCFEETAGGKRRTNIVSYYWQVFTFLNIYFFKPIKCPAEKDAHVHRLLFFRIGSSTVVAMLYYALVCTPSNMCGMTLLCLVVFFFLTLYHDTKNKTNQKKTTTVHFKRLYALH